MPSCDSATPHGETISEYVWENRNIILLLEDFYIPFSLIRSYTKL